VCCRRHRPPPWRGRRGARPLGSHPLFYAEIGSRVLFAASPLHLLDQPGVSRALNRAALADHLCHRWPAPHETLFAAVRRVPRTWKAVPPDPGPPRTDLRRAGVERGSHRELPALVDWPRLHQRRDLRNRPGAADRSESAMLGDPGEAKSLSIPRWQRRMTRVIKGRQRPAAVQESSRTEDPHIFRLAPI
jgi:hypothetical protein